MTRENFDLAGDAIFTHPAEQSEKIKNIENVKQAFIEFSLNMDIADHPDLLDRLADIGDHFQDAVEMARMTDKIWDKLDIDDADRDTLLTATLLHDIGKAGPGRYSTDSEMRNVFKKLFPHGNSSARTFGDLAGEAGFEAVEHLAQQLSKENTPIEINTPAIDFWRYHADWTYEVLKESPLGEDIARIAASHHILEGKNPAGLADQEISQESKIIEVADKYHAHGHLVLAVADKYQAIRERGTIKSHSEIIAILHKIVAGSRVSDELKKDYKNIIDTVFAGAENDWQEVFNR